MNIKYFHIGLLCFAIMRLGIPACYGQKDSTAKSCDYRVLVGLSFGQGYGIEKGLYAEFYLTYIKGNYYAELKASGVEKVRLISSKDESIPSVSDISFILGRGVRLSDVHHLYVGTGLAYTRITKGDDFLYTACGSVHCQLNPYVYKALKVQTIGLPIELKYNLFFRRSGGLSLGFYTNINQRKSFYGVAIGAVVYVLKRSETGIQ